MCFGRSSPNWGTGSRTDTDTEVLAHLIEEAFEGNLERAVAAALTQAEGTAGIAVMSDADPGKIVVARRSAPLLLGIGEDGEPGTWVASDVAAILAHTRRVIYLDDDEIAVLTPGGYETIGVGSTGGRAGWAPIRKEISRVDWDLERIERGGYPHFMLREIHEQPNTPCAMRRAAGCWTRKAPRALAVWMNSGRGSPRPGGSSSPAAGRAGTPRWWAST